MSSKDYINLDSKALKINMDDEGNRIDYCYSDSGNCRKCRCYRDCDWFLYVNGFLD